MRNTSPRLCSCLLSSASKNTVNCTVHPYCAKILPRFVCLLIRFRVGLLQRNRLESGEVGIRCGAQTNSRGAGEDGHGKPSLRTPRLGSMLQQFNRYSQSPLKTFYVNGWQFKSCSDIRTVIDL